LDEFLYCTNARNENARLVYLFMDAGLSCGGQAEFCCGIRLSERNKMVMSLY
jgi:hypothetical protein